jgi:hypothetical protein
MAQACQELAHGLRRRLQRQRVERLSLEAARGIERLLELAPPAR